jgi:hypothetical protein
VNKISTISISPSSITGPNPYIIGSLIHGIIFSFAVPNVIPKREINSKSKGKKELD